MYISGYMMIDILKKYEYSGNPKTGSKYNTVYDLVMSNYDELDPLELVPMIVGMSEGQRALCDVGLTKMIQIATSDTASVKDYFYDALDQQGLNNNELVSIYAGVNRTVFNPDGIAMTDTALRSVAKDNDPSWTEKEYDRETKKAMMFCKGFMIAAASSIPLTAIIITARICINLIRLAVHAGASNIFAYFTAGTFAVLKGILPRLFTSLYIVSGIAIGIILVAFAVMMLVKKEGKQVPKWKEIPKIMCSKEKINSKNIFIYYDVVRNVDTNNPMDVGNWESDAEDRQWMALYISREKRAGKPIIFNSLKVSVKSAAPGVLTLKKFGGGSGVDVASYSMSKKSAYIIYKADTKFVANKVSSVFTSVSSWGFAVAGLAVGIIGGTFLGVGVKRKKMKNNAK